MASVNNDHIPVYSGDAGSTARKITGFAVWVLHLVSIETYRVLNLFITTLMSTAMADLLKQKVCIQLYQLPKETCVAAFVADIYGKIDDPTYVNISIEAESYQLYGEALAIAFGVLVGMFLSPWSDRYGRRIPLIVATIGSMTKILCLLINAIVFDLSPYFILLSYLISGLTGGLIMSTISTYSLISEQTSRDNRTLRYFILDVCFTFSGTLGALVGDYVYKYHGFIAVFLTAETLAVLSILVPIMLIRETAKTTASAMTMLRDLVSLRSIRELVQFGTMTRPNRIRSQFFVLTLAMCFTVLCMSGVDHISFPHALFTFRWFSPEYKIVNTIGTMVPMIVMIPLMVLLTYVKKVPDFIIGLVGCSSLAAKCVLRATMSLHSRKSSYWIYYLSYPVGMAADLAPVALRSRLSKLVRIDELGKLFLLLVACELTLQLPSIPMFEALLLASLHSFGGLPYVVAVFLLIVPVICFLWLYRVPLENGPSLEVDETRPSVQAIEDNSEF